MNATDTISTRQKPKAKARVTPIYRLDGFQHGLPGFSGCHNFTILRKGPALGASFCIEGPENEMPTEDQIMARVLEKERAFRDG